MSENNKIQCVTEIDKQEKSESGRSMVEMLGTLAIIGVLSIGGIAGYTYAMNKSKANDILDGVSKRAVVVSQQLIMGNETPSLVEYAGKKIGDYSVTLSETDYGEGFFGIQVSGVEQFVCERLQGQGLANAADIYLGDAYFDESTCAEGNGNVLTYVFNDSLNADAVAGDGGDDEDDPNVCYESEKILVEYATGECCTEKKRERLCPGEIKTCTVAPNKLEQCRSNCEYWDAENNVCCVLGHESEKCCEYFLEWDYEYDGTTCCSIDDGIVDGYCCIDGEDTSQACCEYWDGVWDGTSCCSFMAGSECCRGLGSQNCCAEGGGVWDNGKCCTDAWTGTKCCEGDPEDYDEECCRVSGELFWTGTYCCRPRWDDECCILAGGTIIDHWCYLPGELET